MSVDIARINSLRKKISNCTISEDYHVTKEFVKEWKEKYCWPLHSTPEESKERIEELEKRMKDVREKINDEKQGIGKEVKDVLLRIVKWKTSGRFGTAELFDENEANRILEAVREVLRLLERNKDDVSECIKRFHKLKGVGIAVASTFLRFLDPNHRYGIIDKHVAKLLNSEGVTTFDLRKGDDYITFSNYNINQYQRYHEWLQQESQRTNFSPVDIEMALFAYMTRKGSTTEKSSC